jgi:hypothetical protein
VYYTLLLDKALTSTCPSTLCGEDQYSINLHGRPVGFCAFVLVSHDVFLFITHKTQIHDSQIFPVICTVPFETTGRSTRSQISVRIIPSERRRDVLVAGNSPISGPMRFSIADIGFNSRPYRAPGAILAATRCILR